MAYIVKAGGKTEEFSEEKLLSSVRRAKIPEELQNAVLTHIRSKIYDGIPSSEIYKHVIEFLSRSPYPHSRARYGLKQAIFDLGPTGYPFEDFVSEIFRLWGYETQTRTILQGKCVSHEIDVIAKKDGKTYIVECKFHQNNGTKSDIHVSLYTKARYDDLKEKNNLDQVLLVTNTKVTTDALSYALCSNMKIISWDYPQNESLRDLVEKFSFHPITTLGTLSQNQKQILLENHIVSCSRICQNPTALNILNLPKEKTDQILEEARYICSL